MMLSPWVVADFIAPTTTVDVLGLLSSMPDWSRDGCGAMATAKPNSPGADLPRLACDGLAPAVIKGDVRHFLLMGARHRSFLSARRCEPQQRHAAYSQPGWRWSSAGAPTPACSLPPGV